MNGTTIAAIFIVAIASLLIGGGVMVLFWRPWKQRQSAPQVQDRQAAREEELDELEHQLEVERLKGQLHRDRVFDHAVWPAWAILRGVDDAVGHHLSEETIKPLVGFVVEQAVQETFGSARTEQPAAQAQQMPAGNCQAPAIAAAPTGRFQGLKQYFADLKANWFGDLVLFLTVAMVIGALLGTMFVVVSYLQDKAIYANSNKPVGGIIPYTIEHMEEMFP